MHIIIAHLRAFAHDHDEMTLFHVVYLAAALIAALFFNLGVFALIIFAHAALDYFKYKEVHGYNARGVIEGIVREGLVDFTLLIVGLVFAVYLHHSVGIASLSGLLRADLALIRVVGMTVPKLKILHHLLKIMAHFHHYLEQIHPHMRREWRGLDCACFYFIGIAIFMLVFSPWIMGVEPELVQEILKYELLLWKIK